MERQTVTTQSWFGIVFFLEYLIFHPLGLLLFYLTWEGIVRFAAGLVLSEVVPSLPLVTALAFRRYLERKKTRHAAQELASIPDSFEVLADVERLRIAAALAKPTWNASLTIGIDGQLYEVESVQEGTPPRRYVYVLKKASSGKILRGYEEYHLGIAKLS